MDIENIDSTFNHDSAGSPSTETQEQESILETTNDAAIRTLHGIYPEAFEELELENGERVLELKTPNPNEYRQREMPKSVLEAAGSISRGLPRSKVFMTKKDGIVIVPLGSNYKWTENDYKYALESLRQQEGQENDILTLKRIIHKRIKFEGVSQFKDIKALMERNAKNKARSFSDFLRFVDDRNRER